MTTLSVTARPKHEAALRVSHAADFYRRYPGEAVTFYTRIDVRRPLPGLTVRVTLGEGLTPEAARVLAGPQVTGGRQRAARGRTGTRREPLCVAERGRNTGRHAVRI